MRLPWAAAALVVLCASFLLASVVAASGASSSALTTVPGSPFGAGGTGSVYSPNGALLATSAAGDQSVVATYAVGAGGGLTAVGSSLLTGAPLTAPVFNPASTLLAVGSESDASVYLFPVMSGGTLGSATTALLPDYASGAGPLALAFSPDGDQLAVADSSDNVEIYDVGNSLTLVGSYPAGEYPGGIAYSPNGQLLAVSNEEGRSISTYHVGSSGALTALGTAPVPGSPVGLTFSPSGSLLAVADASPSSATSDKDDISMYTVSATGALTDVYDQPYLLDEGTDKALAFNPAGTLLAGTTGGSPGKVDLFLVSAGGSLTTAEGSPFAGDEFDATPDFSPNGDYLETIGANGVTVYSVGAATAGTSTTGTATETTPTTAAGGVSLGSVRSKGTTATLAVSCGGSSVGRECSLRLKLSLTTTASIRKKGKRIKETVRLASKTTSITVAVGKSESVSLALGTAGRKLLAHSHTLEAKLSIELSTAAGTTTRVQAVTFRAARKRKA